VQRVQRVVEKTADTLPDRRYPLFCVGGVDINKPRTRAALSAVLALAVSQDGFTVADLATKVQSLTGQSKDDYTVRQAADLRKLRGKRLVVKPGRTRRYHVPGQAARTIAALLTLRDQVIAPILDAGQ